MSDMIERVAKAIEAVEFYMPGAGGLRGRLHIGPAQARYIARAAIEAMREETAAMWDAGAAHTYEGSTRDIWRAMIDAALAEPSHESTPTRERGRG